MGYFTSPPMFNRGLTFSCQAGERVMPDRLPSPGISALTLVRSLFFILALGILAAALAGTLAGLLLVYSTDLPQVDQLEHYRPSSITELYDDQGRIRNPIDEFNTEMGGAFCGSAKPELPAPPKLGPVEVPAEPRVVPKPATLIRRGTVPRGRAERNFPHSIARAYTPSLEVLVISQLSVRFVCLLLASGSLQLHSYISLDWFIYQYTEFVGLIDIQIQ